MPDARTLVRRQVFASVVDPKLVELGLFRIALIWFIATHRTCVPPSQHFMQTNRTNTLQTAYTASHVRTGWTGLGRQRYVAALWPFDRRGVAGVAAMRHDHSGDIS